MLQAIAEVIVRFIIECLLSVLWWLILFPVVWLVSLPFILFIALFRRQPYGFAVANMLASVHIFWRDWGMFCTP
jgi:hypothetical protein